METHTLNEQTALAARYIDTTDRHIFLTGKAGTGKTTFLKYIVAHTYKNTVVAAPTGIAAINAGGVTLHSLLQLPFGAFVPGAVPPGASIRMHTAQSLLKQLRMTGSKRQLLREIELLIIDEVSMLRADLLDCADTVLRHVRQQRSLPFGGLQVLFIGDLMQLAPVVKDDEWAVLRQYYDSSYFFDAQVLRAHPPVTIELQHIYRQKDQDFIDLLNRLRNNEQTPEDIEALNERYYRPGSPVRGGSIHLTTHNRKADYINEERLRQLPGKGRYYTAEIAGDYPEHLYPTSETLWLKVGAQVMFIKNDPGGEGRFFNGKIGEVTQTLPDELWVRFADEAEICVSPYTWEHTTYVLDPVTHEVEERVLGTFAQYPLKLAWAVTIHKSQGLTFEQATLDVSATFAPGQLYVALSRLTSPEGLSLSSPLPKHPPDVLPSLRAFVASFLDTEQLLDEVGADSLGFIAKFTAQVFDFKSLQHLLAEHVKQFDKGENRSAKQQYAAWTAELVQAVAPLAEVGGRFIQQVNRMVRAREGLDSLADRSVRARSYFEPLLTDLRDRIRTHRQAVQKDKQVKGYVKELEALEGAFTHQIRQIVKCCLLVEALAGGRLPSKDMLRDWDREQAAARAAARPEKVPTAEISYRLFEAGKSVGEIAAERGLAVSTIQGHLCQYVAAGKIAIGQLLDAGRLRDILAEMDEPDLSPGELKQRLGDDVSYGEIKLVIAHYQWQESTLKD
ncbi:MAG: helix-turn-helix domain-containing protein [Bacteroidia bacterium]